MKSSSPSTVVTIADARYAWGALMLVASMRKNGMAQPVLVGTHGTWPEAMTRRLLALGGVTIVPVADGTRSAHCDKPAIMTRPEIATDWICWVDADGLFVGDCTEWLSSADPDEIVARRNVPLPLRRGAWPLYRSLAPLAPWVWRAMRIRRKLFRRGKP